MDSFTFVLHLHVVCVAAYMLCVQSNMEVHATCRYHLKLFGSGGIA